VKAGWQEKKLHEICELINGRAYSKSELLPAGKYPVLRVGNFFTNDHWYHSDLELEEKKYCDKGDLLYAWSASFGPRIWAGEKVIFHYHIWKVDLDESLIDKMYLFYFFEWDVVKVKEDHGTGTTMMHVSKGSMEQRDILLPPLPEQKRIVSILDEAFDGIATAKANAEKNLKNARAVFESKLDGVFGQQNHMGWIRIALTDIGSTQTGSTPKSLDQWSYGNFLPFIKPGHFNQDGSLDYKNEGLSEAGAAAARKVQSGSVLMVCIGASIGKAGFCDRDIATNQQINSFTPNKNMSYKFIYYQMLTGDFQRRVIHASGQATLPIINKSKWSALTIIAPPSLDEQLEIVEILDSLREESRRLESIYCQKIALLDELKKALLHKAFAGEL
jgi:type I restriction enzyme S subunit